MMKNIMGQNKGITMISVTIIVIVILILTGVLIYDARDSLKVTKLQSMQSDIQNLRDKISNYYAQYGQIPARIKYTNTDNIGKIMTTGVISPKIDTGDFYIIELSSLENLTLNYGEDYKNITNATTESEASQYEDIYIINETSQNIFYVEGIQVDGEWFYTDYTSEDVDTVAVDLRYFDGIKIPDGYIYNSGTSKEDLSIKNESDTTKIYNWIIIDEEITEIPADVQIEESEQASFIESANLFNGYYKSNTDNTAIYIEDEEKWSPTYDGDGTYTDKNGDTAYIPKGFQVSEKKGETLIDEGLVIRNPSTDDRYIWIEVPKKIYTTATSEEDYTNIEKDIQIYTAKYKEGYEEYSDTWYDECGISSEEEYNNLKNEMLSSVYKNGGFYISQYEIGASSYVTANDDGARTPVSKEGMYPYNWVTVSKAQELATKMDTGEKTSSLMFGVQYDLVLKYLETHGVSSMELTSNSTNWGNLYNAIFDITKGEYSTNKGEKYTEVNGIYPKTATDVLLTTGATKRNSKMNIYDLAGNISEWTLEKSNNNEYPCTFRGGNYITNGIDYPTSYRNGRSITTDYNDVGFRVTLW